MGHSNHSMRPQKGAWCRVLARSARGFLALAVVFSLIPLPALAIISTTINIDGDLNDWTGVRADPANHTADTKISDPDPDYPGQPDRDVYLVNATWDSEYLYLAYRRTAGGTKAITFGAYIDRGGDGLLQNSDVVVWWTVGQSLSSSYADAHGPSPTAGIYKYNQAINGSGGPYTHPGGDPMGHDGETPDGWADVQSGQLPPVKPMDGWFADNGIEFEGKVAWSDLGLAPGSPIAIHFVNANGGSFGQKWVPSDTRKWIGNPPQNLEENRGQVEDNVDGIWWLRNRAVSVSPDNESAGDAGQTLVYAHTVTNASNVVDTFDLSAWSSKGWDVALTNAAGTPISAVTLAAGASTSVRVRVTIPSGTPDGTRDITTIAAVSKADSTVTDSAADTTGSGRITVTPERSGSMAPGQSITYPFTVTNFMPGADRTYDLSSLSSLGFPVTIVDASGVPLSSVTLASGASTQVYARVSVPATATVGMQDVTRLTAQLQGSTVVKASNIATTKVRSGLAITPSNSGVTGPNTQISYTHTITNSWPTTRTVTLSATSSRGWPVSFFAADGVTPITSVIIGPGGATAGVIARVSVPTDIAGGIVDTTTVRATAGATVVTVTDVTTVHRLAVYDSSGYTRQVTDFDLTDKFYGRAMGLAPGDKVVFVWTNSAGAIVRTSPESPVDEGGMAFDDYSSVSGDLTGGWILEVYTSKKGVPTTSIETTPFKVHYKASITVLSATDAPGVGSDVAVTSSVTNSSGKAIANSKLTYTIWWDENGNGVFGAGDTYIDSAGHPHTWDGVSAVSSHVTTGINVAGSGTWSEPAPWTVNNRDFPHQGDYNVSAVWTESGGTLIDTKTTQFYSIPALGWPLFGVLIATVGAFMGRRLRFAPVGDAA